MSRSISKSESGSKRKNKSNPCGANCGVYRFVDSGSTNPANKGKVYIGKSTDMKRRLREHQAMGRVTPGSWSIVMPTPGWRASAVRFQEQTAINSELLGLGILSFNVKSGGLANRINAMSPQRYYSMTAADRFREDAEFGL